MIDSNFATKWGATSEKTFGTMSVRECVRHVLRAGVRPISALALSATLFLGASSLAAQPASARSITHQLAIPAQSLDEALKSLSTSANEQLLFSKDLVEGKQSVPVDGTYTTDQALEILLQDSGLKAERTPSGVLLIKPQETKTSMSKHGANKPVAFSDYGSESKGTIRLAQAESKGSESDKDSDGVNVEEVVVTAQKQGEQRLQEVPVPVSVVSGVDLSRNNLQKLQDYYTQVPSFSVSPNGESQTVLSFRGINSGHNAPPTVGITLDDVPFGGSNTSRGTVLPDVDPSELARVEVLRGPQGVLFGENSLGGLVRFVTADPSTTQLSGRVEVGTSITENGDKAGSNVRGAVNLPLGSTAGIRLSAFTREDPGYIDNPLTGKDGVNGARTSGGHALLLLEPTDIVSLKFGAHLQETRKDSADNVQSEVGQLVQSWLPGTGDFQQSLTALNANLNLKLGAATLGSFTGYSQTDTRGNYDISETFGPLFGQYFGSDNSVLLSHWLFERFTEELRLSAPIGSFVDVQVGGFYSHEVAKKASQTVYAADPTGRSLGVSFHNENAAVIPKNHDEIAVFGNATIKISQKFDIQIGGRESWYDDTGESYFLDGPFVGGAPIETPAPLPASSKVFTYLFTPRLKVTDDLMIYGRLASGYRPGSGSPGRPSDSCVVLHLQCQLRPDTTRNYEIGTKGSLFSDALTFDVSVYYIEWQNLQAPLRTDQGLAYVGNAGGANNRGIEFAVSGHPLRGLTISVTGALADTKLIVPSNSVAAANGSPMPFSPKFSGNFSMNWEFPLLNSVDGYVGGDVAYVGSRMGSFTSVDAPRQRYAPYAQTNLSTGIRWDAWSANLYVNNLFDRRGIIGGGLGSVYEQSFFYIKPRTVGINIAREF